MRIAKLKKNSASTCTNSDLEVAVETVGVGTDSLHQLVVLDGGGWWWLVVALEVEDRLARKEIGRGLPFHG